MRHLLRNLGLAAARLARTRPDSDRLELAGIALIMGFVAAAGLYSDRKSTRLNSSH